MIGLTISDQVNLVGLVSKRTMYRVRLVRVWFAPAGWEGWQVGRWVFTSPEAPILSVRVCTLLAMADEALTYGRGPARRERARLRAEAWHADQIEARL